MSSDPYLTMLREVYGDVHRVDDTHAGHQYARIVLTPEDPADAPVILHTTSSSVRSSVAEQLDEKLSQDVADGAELFTFDPHVDQPIMARLTSLLDLFRPAISRVLSLGGAPHNIGGGTLSAEPVGADYSPVAGTILDAMDDLMGGKDGEDGLNFEEKKTVGKVLRPMSWALSRSRKFTRQVTHHSRLFLLHPSEPPSRKKKVVSDEGMIPGLHALIHQAACGCADALTELGRLQSERAVAMFTSSPDIAGWMALHLRSRGYQISVETFAATDGRHYRKSDMVRPTIRKSHGDNDDALAPSPFDVMAIF